MSKELGFVIFGGWILGVIFGFFKFFLFVFFFEGLVVVGVCFLG